MTKKTTTKTTMAVSLNKEVAAKIKEIARIEERSVSQMVQRALLHYFTLVENEINERMRKSAEAVSPIGSLGPHDMMPHLPMNHTPAIPNRRESQSDQPELCR